MGKLTINEPFSMAMLNYQRVTLLRGKSTISMCHFLIAMLNIVKLPEGNSDIQIKKMFQP